MALRTQCEAMVRVRRTWARCGRAPADLHHRLTRARGGLLLDEVGETYHLMYLCRRHHSVAHDQGSAFENGLLLEGYVITEQGRPRYSGPDPYLSSLYGAVDLPEVQDQLRRAEPGARLRGET